MVLRRSIVVGFVAGFLAFGSFASDAGWAGAGVAWADKFDVYSCHTPSGASAPTAGWSKSIPKGASYDVYTLDTCKEADGALIAALSGETPHRALLDVAEWAFNAPSGEIIAQAGLWRAGEVRGTPEEKPAAYQFWIAARENGQEVLDAVSVQLVGSGEQRRRVAAGVGGEGVGEVDEE